MKLKLKNKIIPLLFIGTPLLLTSCTAKSGSDTAEISFSWWGNEPRHEYTLKGIEEFQKIRPEIKVTPKYAVWKGYEEAFEKSFYDGSSTDVMQINFDWLSKYSPDGNGFYDLNEFKDIIEFHNYTLTDLEYGTINGKLNAVPIAFNTIIPIFNKSVLDKNSFQIPSTWDTLFKYAEILKPQNQYLLGANAKHSFLLAVAWFEQAHSKKVFADNHHLNITESETAEILDFSKQLIKEHVLSPEIQNFTSKSLSNKKIAGAVAWCNEAGTLAKTFESIGGKGVLGNFITANGASETGWYLKPVSMYALKKDSKNPEQAAELINFLLNNSEMALLQKCDKGVPASNKSLTALMKGQALEELQYTSLMKIRFNRGNINPMLPIMENKDLNSTFANLVLEYTNGKISKNEAAKELYEKLLELTKI
ncbi:ABC transporter substrate-binding protein [Treponema sp.]|uniref:ABC transporter substrate-binding protein n=1 Tax=Treponema sp. TaxID=166 RepID=UPI00389047DC